MRVVLRRTVVGSGDYQVVVVTTTHHYPPLSVVTTTGSHHCWSVVVVTTTDNSPSQDYTHLDDQTTLLHVTPGFKPFTVLAIHF